MFVSGFSFIRNAVKYDYPIEEAVRSILPLCNEMIVSIGQSDDGTEQKIEAICSPKIKIFHSVWDDSLRQGGQVLAVETDKAFSHVNPQATWCIYIQGDEVIHEQYHAAILDAMRRYQDDLQVEGLLLRYLHFYGSYDYIGDSRKWYSHEIRIIRNDRSIRSYKDAQGFRKNGRKLQVKEIDACVYHYGWVKHPNAQLQKINNFQQFWRKDGEPQKTIPQIAASAFDYSSIDSVQLFKGTHPAVMADRIKTRNWEFDADIRQKKFSLKNRVLYWIEQKTGKRLFDYRNYKKI